MVFLAVGKRARPFLALSSGSVRLISTTAAAVPRLPIPDLEETGLRYLQSVSALVENEEALVEQSALVADFVTGMGRELQNDLVRNDTHCATRGGYPHFYFQEIWDDGYLGARCENPIHINPHYLFKPDPMTRSQVQQSADFIHSMHKWQLKVRSGALEQDQGKLSQCSSGYTSLLGTARVPCKGRDLIKMDPGNSNHVVVMRSNRFFRLDLCDKDRRVISAEGLAECLDQIVDICNSSPTPRCGLDVLTALPRDEWAEHRQSLCEFSKGNKEAFKQIDSALVMLSLDAAAPEKTEDVSRSFLHGLYTGERGVTNRWFDKHQVFCDGAGNLGMNFEHSHNDGMVWNRMCSEVIADMNGEKAPEGLSPLSLSGPTSSCGAYSELTFEYPDGFDAVLDASLEAHQAHSNSCDTKVLLFEDFGKKRTKQWGLSPDGVAQMAFQLAYFRLHGQIPPTYEAASTKKFSHGRTETIRSASPKAAEWCRYMTSGPDFLCKDTASSLLRSAVENHVELAKSAASGQGIDRHLLALKTLAAENGLGHDLFDSPLFRRSSTWILSTSNVTAPFLSLFGFGPVAENGYGLGYCVFDDKIPINITSWASSKESSSEDMVSAIRCSLRDIRNILD